MEITYKQDCYIKAIIKWTSLFICLSLCVYGVNTMHQYQLQKLTTNSALLIQKTSLMTQLHREMLSITRTQYQILHSSNHKQARQLISNLSRQVSDYLIHYQQFEQVADSSDVSLLSRYKMGFEQWHQFNQDLLSYANVVADSGFINTLNMAGLAFSQFDSNTDMALQLIAQLKQDVGHKNELSN